MILTAEILIPLRAPAFQKWHPLLLTHACGKYNILLARSLGEAPHPIFLGVLVQISFSFCVRYVCD